VLLQESNITYRQEYLNQNKNLTPLPQAKQLADKVYSEKGGLEMSNKQLPLVRKEARAETMHRTYEGLRQTKTLSKFVKDFDNVTQNISNMDTNQSFEHTRRVDE